MIQSVAGLGFGIGSGLMSTPIGAAANVLLDLEGTKRLGGYLTNIAHPNVFPSPDLLFSLLRQETGDKTAIYTALSAYGIALHGKPQQDDAKFNTFLWNKVYESSWPIPDLSTAYIAKNRELISQQRFDLYKKRHGDKTNLFDFMSAYLRPHLTPIDLIAIYNRGLIDRDMLDRVLVEFYGYDEWDRTKMVQMSSLIPPPTDVIRFAVREAFNPQQVAALGLDLEYNENPQYRILAEKLGLKTLTEANCPGIGQPFDVAKAYWRAHWDYPSNQQTYEMLHRLRPERIGKYQAEFPDITPFVLRDLNNVLKANDVLPQFRDKLAAINSHVVTRLDLQRVYNYGQFDENEVFEQYRDYGYLEDDARALTNVAMERKKEFLKQQKRKRFSPYAEKFSRELQSSYLSGAINEATLKAGLAKVYDDDELVQLIVSGLNVKLNTDYVKEYVKSIRSNYMMGGIAFDNLRDALSQAGLTSGAVNRYADLWFRQLTQRRKVASTEKLLSWYRYALIDATEAQIRLRNLGWRNPDIMLWINDTNRLIDADLQKARMVQARTEKQAKLETEKEMRRIKGKQRDERAEFERHSSPAMMKRWYKLTAISEPEVRERLEFLDWPKDDIERFVIEMKEGVTNGEE